MPNVELSAFIEAELASNPLLERAEEHEGGPDRAEAEPDARPAEAPPEPGDWASEALETDAAALAANLGTEIENAFDSDRPAPAEPAPPADGLTATSWAGMGGGGSESGEGRWISKPMSPTRRLCVSISSARPACSLSIPANG